MPYGAIRGIILTSLLTLALGCSQPAPPAELASHEDGPSEPTGLGSPERLLFWTPEQQLVGYRNFDRVFPARVIAASDDPYPLPARHTDLSGVVFDFQGETYDLESFIEHNYIHGLLVLKDGGIVLERYEDGNTARTKWVSFSIAKSVVAMLMGAAFHDGYIDDLDVSVTDYLPMMKGSAYEEVTIRQAMQMASGVEWDEDYGDPESDINQSLSLGTLDQLRLLAGQPRLVPAGEQFNYNTAETHLIAAVLRSAIGNNLAAYLSSKIWRPFGMESDAHWMLLEPDGAEHGGCCISATLRDYGRIGLFALAGGVLPNGERVLPADWMQESTVPSPANEGYGSLWWLQDGGAYSAIGVFGQMIWIDPASQIVVVTHSAWPEATPFFGHGWAFSRAVSAALGD